MSSSVIKSFKADKEKGLVIEFLSGSAYSYPDVTDVVFKEFKEAESKGTYFAKNIRPHFKSVKIA